MKTSPLLTSSLVAAAIVIVGLLFQTHGQAILLDAQRDQLARIDRHDRARIEASAASTMLKRVNDAPSAQR